MKTLGTINTLLDLATHFEGRKLLAHVYALCVSVTAFVCFGSTSSFYGKQAFTHTNEQTIRLRRKDFLVGQTYTIVETVEISPVPAPFLRDYPELSVPYGNCFKHSRNERPLLLTHVHHE